MGFGTLFIGYFLLLNVTYYQFTDIIAALIMLYGLYKLSLSSKYFRLPMLFTFSFAALGVVELGIGCYTLFNTADIIHITMVVSIVRSVILCILTLLILRAIHNIGRDLEVDGLPLKCQTMMVWTLIFYAAYIVFDTNFISKLLPDSAVAVIYIVLILASIILPIANLVVIYTAYRWICLPEDLDKKPKPFGFNGNKQDEEDGKGEVHTTGEGKRKRGKK